MTRIWEWNRPVTVREVLEDLQKERTIAYTTVMTVLDNLHQKGWVRREAEGRAYRYEAVSTRAAYAAALMNESWSASDNPAAALVAFFGMMSPEQRAALRDAVHMVGIEQTRSAASDEGPGTPAASPSSSSPATAGAPPSPASPAPEEPKSPNGGPAPGKEADARPDGRVPETGSAPAEESARRPDEPEDDRPEERGPDADRPEEDAVGHGPASREARAEPGPSGPDAER